MIVWFCDWLHLLLGNIWCCGLECDRWDMMLVVLLVRSYVCLYEPEMLKFC